MAKGEQIVGAIKSKGKNKQQNKHHASDVPKLSLEERERRWGALRESMNIEGLDCLVLIGNDMRWGAGLANVRYVTQIGSYAGTIGFFPMVGEPVVWADMIHQHIPSSRYCFTQNWIEDIRPETGPVPIVNYIKEKHYDRSSIGLVGASEAFGTADIIPYGTVVYLQRELPNARIVDATPMVNRLRMIKSAEEISMMEKAGEIAQKVIETAIQSAEPGKKESEVFADMVHTQIINGGEAQIFIMLTSGPPEGPENNKQLLHGNHQPTVPTMRILQKGDLVMFEMHTFYGGYVASSEFSLCLGKAPEALKRIHSIAVECLEKLRRHFLWLVLRFRQILVTLRCQGRQFLLLLLVDMPFRSYRWCSVNEG